MKRFFLICLLFCWGIPAQAQLFSKEKVRHQPGIDDPRWSWGYFLGLNTYDFDFDYKRYISHPASGQDVEVSTSLGFNVGLVGNLRINNNLDLRLEPGVAFNRMELQWLSGAPATSTRDINSTYVHIPLLLKYSTNRLNNFKPFIVGGLSTSINLSSNEDNPSDNEEGQFRMTTHSFYYEVGFGIDFYLEYFKFSPSIRGVFAINDELIRDNNESSPYTRNIAKMSSRGIFLNFTFQ